MEASVAAALKNTTLSLPPSGVIPTLANSVSGKPHVFVGYGICIPLIVVVSTLRLYAKLTILEVKPWTDLTCLVGVLAGLGYIPLTVETVAGGTPGGHQSDLMVGELSKHRMILTLISDITYPACTWFIKFSLFVFLLDLFGSVRWLRQMVIAGMIVTGLYYWTALTLYAVVCTPRGAGPHPPMSYYQVFASARCVEARHMLVGTAVFNVISDLYLTLLPIPVVWSLVLPIRKKLGVLAIFLTGFIACVASVVALGSRVYQYRNPDDSCRAIPTCVATIVEMTAGILVCCMPTTAAVIRHWKYPISSFLTLFRRLIRPRSFVHLEDHAKLSPASDLRPCRRHPPDIRGAMALVENGGSGSGPPSLDCSQNNAILSLGQAQAKVV